MWTSPESCVLRLSPKNNRRYAPGDVKSGRMTEVFSIAIWHILCYNALKPNNGTAGAGFIPAAEWGENPRETVTVMPVYSAKSDTQGAAPGHRHLRSRSCRIEFASPGCLWRPGDFLSSRSGVAAAAFYTGAEFKPLRPQFLSKSAIEAFA